MLWQHGSEGWLCKCLLALLMKRLRAWRFSKTDTQPPRSVARPATSDTSVKSNERPNSSPTTPPSFCGASASTSLPSVAAGVCTSPANASGTLSDPPTSSRTPATTVRDDDLAAQFRRDFLSQCAQHAEKFSVLLQELEYGHQQRDREFREMYLATGQAFDIAQRGRRQEWLQLQEALERGALDMRNSLLARARDQREEHDRQASRSLQACEAFADRMLERMEEARYQVEESVQSLLVSLMAERNERPNKPAVNQCDMPSFRMQHAFRLQLVDITPSFPRPPPRPERTYSPEIMPQAITPAPTFEEPPSLQVEALIPVKSKHLEGSASSSDTGLDDLSGEELMYAFDEHLFQSEDLRRQNWQCLQDFYDSCFPKWQDSFYGLQNALTSTFVLSTQDGTIGRILCAEETVRISVCTLFSDAEASRIEELKRSWSRQRQAIASCYDAFIRTIKMSECTRCDMEAYHWIPRRGLRRRPSTLSLTQASGVSPTDGEVVLPFSLMLIFRRPRISQPLLTTSSLAQARNAFAESQRMRDRAFQASISTLRADSRMLEAKRVDQFTAALFEWQSKAAAAERERTAEFERRMDATKTEWSAYHAQSSRSADDLIAELGKEFSKAQAVREEVYEDAVREAHALFMTTIGEFPPAYRALLSSICDEEERARPPPV